jgi:FKBP-type peptidyl-prolyl cis-trans isomerase 2
MMQKIGKIIIKDGSEPIDFSDGGKASIHFCAKTQNGQQIEDTRCNGGGPFELRLGKQFCMPALEAAVRSMKLGEVITPGK